MRSQLPSLPAPFSLAVLSLLPLLALSGCPTISKSELASRIDDDADGFTSAQVGGDDCNDADDTVNPGTTDTPYDGIDADCSGGSDNDADGDGYDAATVDGAPADGDDCDDGDDTVHPGASEICDGSDNDCDGAIGDVSSPSTDESDNDGDGFFVCANDCDDTDAASNPGAAEVCDDANADEDCDGSTDDGDSSATGQADWFRDSDSDGYGSPETVSSQCDEPAGFVDNSEDCDDGDDAVNPDTIWYADADEDGWGDDLDWLAQCTQPEGYVVDAGDCLDTDPDVHPEAAESCNDIDDDCDDLVDADDPDVDPSEAVWYRDRDSDGYGDEAATITTCTTGAGYVHTVGDCDDYAATVSPSAPEVCDYQDNDCDGYVDDTDLDVSGMSTWYDDVDGDGFGDAADTRFACFAPSHYVSDATDCDDGDGAVNPDAEEVCDGVDNDCDSDVDDADPSVSAGVATYTDGDGDGFGDSGTATTACSPPVSNVYVAGDCDDAQMSAYPGAPEVWYDGIDGDCDGGCDFDQDGDGDDADGYDGGDCDDGDPDVNPEAAEVCRDGVDNNCDGSANSCANASRSLAEADAKYTGEEDYDQAGGCVSAAGDVNGDGFDDILIGAPASGDGGVEAGAAYLVLGGTAPTSLGLASAAAEYTGGEGDFAGYGLAAAGDVNGDGYGDILVGSPVNDGTSPGAASLILGGAVPATTSLSMADAEYIGVGGDAAGRSMSAAGDVNSDGFDDILVGALGNDAEGAWTGAAYLVLGEATPASASLSSAIARYSGTTAGESAGISVAGGGDIDGDGYVDLLVGAYGNNENGEYAGAAYLVLGNGSPSSTSLAYADAKYSGVSEYDMAGLSVAVAGDVNADGYADVLIGAKGNDDGGSQAGAAYLVLGGVVPASVVLSAADAEYTGEASSDEAGWPVAPAGDVDGDGYSDVLVGAPANSTSGFYAGAAYLILGGAAPASHGLSTADATFTGEAVTDYAGLSLAGVGDVNADGSDDLLIGAYGNDPSGLFSGAAYLILGSGL